MAVDNSTRTPRTNDDYQRALLQLMPRGLAWNNTPDTDQGRLMLATGDSFARIDADKCAISNERYPDQATIMLEDWEDFLGLPECGGLSQSVNERQSIAGNKMRFYGSMNYRFYIELAAGYGYSITIDEPAPFIGNITVASDELPSREATVNDDCMTPLMIYSATDLQCVLERYKPAHETFVYIFDSNEA